MSVDPFFIAAEPAPSSRYFGFYRSSRYINDGSGSFADFSANAKPLVIGTGTTQAAVLTDLGFLRATSAVAGTDGGFHLLSSGGIASTIGAWDLLAGQSLITAFEFKTPAAPSVSSTIMGGDGPGTTGFHITMNTNGTLAVSFRDAGGHTASIGNYGGATLYDGNVHRALLIVDGVAKTGYFYIDDVLQAPAVSLSALTVSTQNVFNFSFGHAGNFASSGTWDAPTSRTSAYIDFRNIHILVTANTTTLSNLAGIATWFSEGANRFYQLPASLLT